MSLRKDIKAIKQMVEEMHKDYDDLLKKERKLAEQTELLKHVKFVVKRADTMFNQNTLSYGVVVEYELPKVQVDFEVGGEQMTNDRLRASNMLDLISFDDMQKIKQALDEAKKLNEGGIS